MRRGTGNDPLAGPASSASSAAGQSGHQPGQFGSSETVVISSLSGGATGRRPSSANRRSFFRRKKAGRSSSRESKELASFSDTASLGWSAEAAGGLAGEEASSPVHSYVRVERFDCEYMYYCLLFYSFNDQRKEKLQKVVKKTWTLFYDMCHLRKNSCRDS